MRAMKPMLTILVILILSAGTQQYWRCPKITTIAFVLSNNNPFERVHHDGFDMIYIELEHVKSNEYMIYSLINKSEQCIFQIHIRKVSI